MKYIFNISLKNIIIIINNITSKNRIIEFDHFHPNLEKNLDN
jgi:hypothetical protein